jgi:hypothetical protein
MSWATILGGFFHKLIRSHWLRPSSYLLLLVMLEATTPPSISSKISQEISAFSHTYIYMYPLRKYGEKF